MNSRTKIVTGVVAGLIAGASVMGAAFAAPQPLGNAAPAVYRMMESALTSATAGIPVYAEMQSFMDRYRTSSGAIDVNRMHADVTSGRVTPPCLSGRSSGASSSARSGQATPGVGYGMMGSY